MVRINDEISNTEIKVAFQGESGAYSESAVFSFFTHSTQPKPYKDLPSVFKSVDTEETQYGVVPIENSIEGSVNRTYDLLLEYPLKVCGEIILRIVHCLIANPQTDLNSIKSVYSHPQALAQCRSFLEKVGYISVPAFDTAGSVRLIKEKKIMDAAAIASERAAEIYKMRILAKGIEDDPNNYTRFLVLSKHALHTSEEAKTSIIFSTKHVPGALYHALEEFAIRDINITRIESRPSKKKPWEYKFYLDFEGHINKKRCTDALKALDKKTSFIKILGSYPKALKKGQ